MQLPIRQWICFKILDRTKLIQETDLYPPVKEFLTSLGYEVKAEVKGCDVVARKEDAPTVIVELKTSFSLDLVLQGIDRQNLTDDVYLAIPAPNTPQKRKNWRSKQRDIQKLCRKLGLGLILVSVDKGDVVALLDPAPYAPRKNKRKETRLVAEFNRRAGDPNTGGSTRKTIVTAYRQDAMRCADLLKKNGPMKVADLRAQSGADNAASILQKNHYGWFERVSRGVYTLTEKGAEENAK